jgi:hypothetical protein
MLKTNARVVAWLLLALIAFVTLAPLPLRPESGAPAWLERFAAYLVMSAAFALGYPGARRRVALALIVVAIGLEFGQDLSPTRHGRPLDALEKALGALAGVAGVALAEAKIARRRAAG